jgi:hypothetical protein
MRQIIAFVFLWCAGLSAANAHLMLAQRGTLNFVDDGVFMVLSVPASALAITDDDGDGKLSMAELNNHHSTILTSLHKELRLTDKNGARPLEGIMLMPSPPDETPSGPADQLIVLGRFSLANDHDPLHFQIGLFGKNPAEQSFQVTVTQATRKQLLVLNKERMTVAVFPTALAIFSSYLTLGAEHIVMGLDHLLFLLVILSTGWGWRHIFTALTAFTLGHAVTLVASVWGVISVPSAVVEPTIAATIIAMAAYDIYANQRRKSVSPWVRLALVFACALIHGLGLATALSDLGLDSQNQFASLAGFNLGIELGQLAIALVFALCVLCIKRAWGKRGIDFTNNLAPWLAMSCGCAWLVQRLTSTV